MPGWDEIPSSRDSCRWLDKVSVEWERLISKMRNFFDNTENDVSHNHFHFESGELRLWFRVFVDAIFDVRNGSENKNIAKEWLMDPGNSFVDVLADHFGYAPEIFRQNIRISLERNHSEKSRIQQDLLRAIIVRANEHPAGSAPQRGPGRCDRRLQGALPGPGSSPAARARSSSGDVPGDHPEALATLTGDSAPPVPLGEPIAGRCG